jgi:ArsR family transcriptional regulator
MSTTCCESNIPGNSSSVDIDDIARMCKALGHPARVRLLIHLIERGGCYFGSLTDVLPLAPSTISQHVTILKEAGLILGSSDEQKVCYCVNPDRVKQLQLAISSL